MNWLDLGLIVLLIILLIVGIKKGFMTSMLSNFSFSINAILSFFLCKPVAWIYNKIGVGGAIARSYSEKLLEKSATFATNLIELSEETLPTFVDSTIEKGGFSGITEWMFKVFLNKSTLYDELHASSHSTRSLADIISETYSSFFVSIISFVTCVLFLYLVVWLISLLVKKLREIGFVKVVDSILGALYGLFRVFLILIVICLIIKLLSPISFMHYVTDYISDSFFGKMIYNQINSFIDNYLNFQDIVNFIFKK